MFSTNSSVIFGLSDCNRKFVGKQTPRHFDIYNRHLFLSSTISIEVFVDYYCRLLSKLYCVNKNGSPQFPGVTSRRDTKDRPRLFNHHCLGSEPDFDRTLFDCCTDRQESPNDRSGIDRRLKCFFLFLAVEILDE